MVTVTGFQHENGSKMGQIRAQLDKPIHGGKFSFKQLRKRGEAN